MEGLMVFLGANLPSILLIIGFAILCFVLVKKGCEHNVRLMVLGLVCKIENKFGSGTGDIKYELVVSEFMEHAPKLVKFLFDEEDIDNFIEDAVKMMKEWLQQ